MAYNATHFVGLTLGRTKKRVVKNTDSELVHYSVLVSKFKESYGSDVVGNLSPEQYDENVKDFIKDVVAPYITEQVAEVRAEAELAKEIIKPTLKPEVDILDKLNSAKIGASFAVSKETQTYYKGDSLKGYVKSSVMRGVSEQLEKRNYSSLYSAYDSLLNATRYTLELYVFEEEELKTLIEKITLMARENV